MSQERKLLVALVVLVDFVLLLVWVLGDWRTPSTVVADVAASGDAMGSEARQLERPDEQRSKAAMPSVVSSARARATQPASLSALASVQVRGTIYGLDGRALIGMAVGLRARDGQGRVVDTSANSRADFYLDGLEPGTWTVLVRAEGYHDLQATLELRTDEPVHHLDPALQRRDELRVRLITPEGGSLAALMETDREKLEVIPMATRVAPGAQLSDAQARELALLHGRIWRPPASQEDASRGFGSDIEGVLRLLEPLPAFISAVVGDTVLRTERAQADVEVITLVLSPIVVRSTLASARLTVVAAHTGAALAGASVSLQQELAISDASRVVRFEGLRPGLCRLDVQRSGYETIRSEVHLDPGRMNDLGQWKVDPAASISGRFRDSDGNAVAIHWSLAGDENGARIRSCAEAVDSFTFATGLFSASHVGRGTYWIRTRDEMRYAPPTRVDTSQGAVKDIVIRVSAGVPVTLRFGSLEHRYVRFAIEDRTGAPVREGGSFGNTARVCLGPGSYCVHYQVGDDPPATKVFDVDLQTTEVVVSP